MENAVLLLNLTIDLAQGKVLKTFSVDPGPSSLDVNAAKNQLLALCEGTGTLEVVDLTCYPVLSRINAGGSTKAGTYPVPLISSVTPSMAAAGSTFTLTMNGTNFSAVKGLEFQLAGATGMGGGMGGSMGQGLGQGDTNVKLTNFTVNTAGTQITCFVPATRLTLFTITK